MVSAVITNPGSDRFIRANYLHLLCLDALVPHDTIHFNLVPQGMITFNVVVHPEHGPHQSFNLTIHRDSTFRAVKSALGLEVGAWNAWLQIPIHMGGRVCHVGDERTLAEASLLTVLS